MVRNKIIAIMTCGVLVTFGITGGALISKKNTNEKAIQNHVLLAAPNLNNLAVVINTNVNPLVLYSSANSNSNVESYISVGEMLNYTATNNPNFYKVTVQETGATGYISANNMQIVESGLNKAYENINKNGQVINVTYDVKLMSSPDVHSQILGSYKNNTKMKVLGKQDQWYKIDINGQIGYMYQEYVGIDDTNNTTNNSNISATPSSSAHVDNMQTSGVASSKNSKVINTESKSSSVNNTQKNNINKSCQVTVKTINAQGKQVGAISTFNANDGSSYTPAPAQNVAGEYVNYILVNGLESASRTITINGPTNIVVQLGSYGAPEKEGNPNVACKVTVKTLNPQGKEIGFTSMFNANDGSSYTPAPTQNIAGEYVNYILVNGVKSTSRTITLNGDTNIVVQLGSYDK